MAAVRADGSPPFGRPSPSSGCGALPACTVRFQDGMQVSDAPVFRLLACMASGLQVVRSHMHMRVFRHSGFQVHMMTCNLKLPGLGDQVGMQIFRLEAVKWA